MTAGKRFVTFIQDDEPALKDGEYTITVHQKTPSQPEPNDFSATRRFAVTGERFRIDPAEIAGVFPPDLANGEYSGVLPHVLINRRTLPWERDSVPADAAAPWLAVLLFDESEAPKPQRSTAKDLVPDETIITALGSKVTGKGAMPLDYVSYPGLEQLDYGETPDDDCITIDVDSDLFSRIAPAAADLHFLGHVRESDTVDTHDTIEASTSLAVVLGNRVPLDNQKAQAFLVSLEKLGSLLPQEDGTRSASLTASCVRLLAYRWWSFTANTMGETFAALLENINGIPPTGQHAPLTSLQVPFAGARPTQPEVANAMKDQAAGNLTETGASVLVHNAFATGYLPLAHHLRHGGETVSWYRGPLAPLPVKAAVTIPIASADAALRYDPETGMFDVSYASAWQLGRLLGLQNETYSMALYNWRRHVRQQTAIAAEQKLIAEMLGGEMDSVTNALNDRILARGSTEPPHSVVHWLARLSLLHGLPFNYLVPDERMLPPESLRVFHVDRAWMTALLDGAFSIGRATTGERRFDSEQSEGLHKLVHLAARKLRPNVRPTTTHTNPSGEVSGFLMRSQAVAGWPHVNVFGYTDSARTTEVPKLRLARLSSEVMLCLFDGVVGAVGIHEAPGQLHCGVEGSPGGFSTTLREANPPNPGHQYAGSAPVVARKDGRTLMVAVAAKQICATLEGAPYNQVFADFTSAEFALQMMKGVVEVEFVLGA